MYRFIKHLQKKPPASRARFAFGAAFVITAAMAFFWFSSLSERLSLSPEKEPDVGKEVSGLASPFSILKEKTNEAYRELEGLTRTVYEREKSGE